MIDLTENDGDVYKNEFIKTDFITEKYILPENYNPVVFDKPIKFYKVKIDGEWISDCFFINP